MSRVPAVGICGVQEVQLTPRKMPQRCRDGWRSGGLGGENDACEARRQSEEVGPDNHDCDSLY